MFLTALFVALTAQAAPLATTIELPCEGCKTDANLAIAPDANETDLRDQLVVYVPGTDCDASKFGLVADTAASVGFHAVSVGWVNGQTFVDYCGTPADADEGNACMDEYAAHIRLGEAARPDGGWEYTADLYVASDDALEARVAELLTELADTTADGWEQFLTVDGTVDWSKVVVGGFSQGAQHARRIAAAHETLGLLMVDGGAGIYLVDEDPNRDDVVCRPFDGRFACTPVITGATPADRWTGIYDATNPLSSAVLRANWDASGMGGTDSHGDSADEDGELSVRAYTQQCAGASWTHLAMSVDGWMPVDSDCTAPAEYPRDAGAFHLYGAIAHLLETAAGPVPETTTSAPTELDVAAARTFDADTGSDTASSTEPTATVGCSHTGTEPLGLFAFAPMLLALARRQR